MLNHDTSLNFAFQALVDDDRCAMLVQFARGPASMSELAQPLDISLPTVMQHLAVLESSGLVRSEKVGRVRTCRIKSETLSLAEQWISQRHPEREQRFDRFGAHLETLRTRGDVYGSSH